MLHEFYRWTWTAVLKRAEKDLRSRSSRIRESALRWFLNDDFDVNAFRGVCSTLNLDASDFRERLLKKYNIEKLILDSDTKSDTKFNIKELSKKLSIYSNKKTRLDDEKYKKRPKKRPKKEPKKKFKTKPKPRLMKRHRKKGKKSSH